MINKFKITIDDNDFEVTVNETEHNKAKVEVNGISYDVRYENKSTVASPLTRKVAGPVAPQVQVQQPTTTTQTTIKSRRPSSRRFLAQSRPST